MFSSEQYRYPFKLLLFSSDDKHNPYLDTKSISYFYSIHCLYIQKYI